MGKVNIYPSNWKTVRADVKLKWYIKYIFYDDSLKQKKQVTLKGMNDCNTLKEKQDAIKMLLEQELHILKTLGYNRITKQYTMCDEGEISEYTPFLEALQYASKRIKISHNSMLILKSCLKYITLAAQARHYDQLPVGTVRRKHIVLLFEKIEEIKKKEGKSWSAHSYNSTRSYLGLLYKELEKLEVVQANLAYKLDKEEVPEKIRRTLTPEERTIVNEHLYTKYPAFWRFTNIFFHSGCRETELMHVRKEDVDLKSQLFKVTIIKGKARREVLKVIKDIALPLWEELMNEAKPGMYLFSKGLVPGKEPIQSYQITKRWYRLVKKPLGIEADFYAWKHLNSDETAAALNIQAAAAMNSHTSTVITMKHYATNETSRQRELLKKLNNKMA